MSYTRSTHVDGKPDTISFDDEVAITINDGLIVIHDRRGLFGDVKIVNHTTLGAPWPQRNAHIDTCVSALNSDASIKIDTVVDILAGLLMIDVSDVVPTKNTQSDVSLEMANENFKMRVGETSIIGPLPSEGNPFTYMAKFYDIVCERDH